MTAEELDRLLLLADIGRYILRNFDIEPDATLSEMLEQLDQLENQNA